MPQQCETCENPIREHCYVSIGPEQQIFCFGCCPLAGPPKINPDRIICGGTRTFPSCNVPRCDNPAIQDDLCRKHLEEHRDNGGVS